MEKQIVKRPRSENWTQEDVILLKELVQARVSCLENKNTDTNTTIKKVAAWKELGDNLNMMTSGAKRTVAQLKTKWAHIKVDCKKERAQVRQHIIRTGGGPPGPSAPVCADDIEAWLPQEFAVDHNVFDSDSTNAHCTPDIMEPIAATDHEDYNKISLDTNTCNKEKQETAAPPKKKKNKKTPEEIIAENEVRCRNELHEVQLRNENLKFEMLLAKRELIELKK